MSSGSNFTWINIRLIQLIKFNKISHFPQMYNHNQHWFRSVRKQKSEVGIHWMCPTCVCACVHVRARLCVYFWAMSRVINCLYDTHCLRIRNDNKWTNIKQPAIMHMHTLSFTWLNPSARLCTDSTLMPFFPSSLCRTLVLKSLANQININVNADRIHICRVVFMTKQCHQRLNITLSLPYTHSLFHRFVCKQHKTWCFEYYGVDTGSNVWI